MIEGNGKMQKSRIITIQQWLTQGKLSCEELTQRYLSRMQKEEPQLNAYITQTGEQALICARRVDEKIRRKEPLSPLEGVPMTLKDNISTASIRTTCASRMLEHYVPIYDAAAWRYLQEQNAVLLGKTNLDEFAMGSSGETSYFGATQNPVRSGYVPGGSSSGTAAAVGANLAVYGLGSDTGGSIRQPAAFCGVVGVKPTYGAVSRNGLIAHASGLDQIGPIAPTAQDAALVLDVISQHDEQDSTSLPGERKSCAAGLEQGIEGLRFGVVREYDHGITLPVTESLERAAAILEQMGARRVELKMPELHYALPVYYVLACAQAASNLGRYDGVRFGRRAEHYDGIDDMIRKSRGEGFGKEVKHRILLGTYVLSEGYYDAYYRKAQQMRGDIEAAFAGAFGRCDFLLAPTASGTSYKIGEKVNCVDHYQTDICTVPANLAGLPALSLPCGFDGDGLPVGMQLTGPKCSEPLLLRVAYQFERHTDGCYQSGKDWEESLWSMN